MGSDPPGDLEGECTNLSPTDTSLRRFRFFLLCLMTEMGVVVPNDESGFGGYNCSSWSKASILKIGYNAILKCYGSGFFAMLVIVLCFAFYLFHTAESVDCTCPRRLRY